MTTISAILDCPFPIVRPVHLSDHHREQILHLLDSISVEPYLKDDTVAAAEVDYRLALVSGIKGSPRYFVQYDGFCLSMGIESFSQSPDLATFRKSAIPGMAHWEKMTNIGHSTDSETYTGKYFPHFRITADLFSDNRGQTCVAEVAFLPIAIENGPQRFFQINKEFDDMSQRFTCRALILWERLEKMCNAGESFEVYTNAISGESFIRVVWTSDEDEYDTFSAIVCPSAIFPSGSFSIFTKEKE